MSSSSVYKGVNWGKLNITQQGITLCPIGSNSTIFNLDYQNITNSTVNKNDIIIQTSNQQLNKDDCICQIRFYVQPNNTSTSNKQMQQQNQDKQGAQNSNQSEEQKQQKNKNNSVALAIHKEIVERGKIGQFAGDSIITLNDVNLVVPRGKYSVDFYQKNIRFHGITYSYNIDYRNISKGFILPMANQAQISLVLQLNKPIYQGQTVYPYIVIQVKKETEIQVKTKIKPQQEKDKKFQNLQPQYKGPLYQVFADIVKTLAEIQLIVPGTQFKSKTNQACIKCSVKTQSGYLYPLKKSLIFIPKPVTYFKTEEIKKVQFLRLTSTTKQFDLKITLSSDKKSIQYTSIQRPQLQVLIEYFKSREIKVEMQQTNVSAIIPDVDDDQSDDQDFEGGQQDDESSSSEDSQDDQENQQGQSSENKKKEKKNNENKSDKKDKSGEKQKNNKMDQEE